MRAAYKLHTSPVSAVSWFDNLPTHATRVTAGGQLPSSFWKPNKYNVRGGIEEAFLSTTYEKSVAFGYASKPGEPGIVFELQMGATSTLLQLLCKARDVRSQSTFDSALDGKHWPNKNLVASPPPSIPTRTIGFICRPRLISPHANPRLWPRLNSPHLPQSLNTHLSVCCIWKPHLPASLIQ